MSVALITGVSGQDSAYLAKSLLRKKSRASGTVRLGTNPHYPALRAPGIERDVQSIPVDFADTRSLSRAVEIAAPDEVYHLAVQSVVVRSFREATYTGDITGLGVVRLLQAHPEVWSEARSFISPHLS